LNCEGRLQRVVKPDQPAYLAGPDHGLYDLKRRHPQLNVIVTHAEPDGSGYSLRRRNRFSRR